MFIPKIVIGIIAIVIALIIVFWVVGILLQQWWGRIK